MRNPLVRVLLALSIGVALASGSALAKVGKESKKPATKTIAIKKNNSISKDAAARRARIKKLGSATPKEPPKASRPAKPTKPNTHSGATKKNPAQPAHAQIASNSDGGSVAERRARIHTMRVPE
jgi:hypothetical protein